MAENNDALGFLRKHGHTSLVSLGSGCRLNRIDNHLRLMKELNLTYYVGIDCVPYIKLTSASMFSDHDGMTELLTNYYQGKPQKFWGAVRVFPDTWVEDLAGVKCAVVVCQRVYPDCRWEDVIVSMKPKLMLQEDLHGCERQQIRGRGYVRTLIQVRRYDLQPFRPRLIFPWERNLILWRRRDFGDDVVPHNKAGYKVDRIYSEGPYKSAADDFKL